MPYRKRSFSQQLAVYLHTRSMPIRDGATKQIIFLRHLPNESIGRTVKMATHMTKMMNHLLDRYSKSHGRGPLERVMPSCALGPVPCSVFLLRPSRRSDVHLDPNNSFSTDDAAGMLE